tara:strand:- start:60012 stop:60410 length:399 start_codon:yes stop_codon:yes gene_type:complete
MIKDAIYNPANSGHFMQLDRLEQVVRIEIAGKQIAASGAAIRLLEVGGRLYPPQYYIPRADIHQELLQTQTASHCPLKGQASYYSIPDGDGGNALDDIAWSFQHPHEFAQELAGYVAFDPTRVTITIDAKVQ